MHTDSDTITKNKLIQQPNELSEQPHGLLWFDIPSTYLSKPLECINPC